MMSYHLSKKINFFGDSWFWNWYGPGFYDYQLKSKTMKTESFCSDSKAQSVNSIKMYCNEIGFITKTFNMPGHNFYETTDSILRTKPDVDILVNVIFFSNLIRLNNYRDFPVHDYKDTLLKIQQDTINLLKQIIKWAEENKTYVFLIGGHSQLTIDVFKSAGYSNYVILLSECIIADIASLLHKKDIEPFGIFRLACFTKHINENWDEELVDIIYNETKKLQSSPYSKLVTFPDLGHLNSLSSMVLLDLIFNKLENLQLIK